MNAKKIAAIVLAVVLVFGCGVGATLAWLLDNTNTVTNTFTVGDINIDLTETVGDDSLSAAVNAVENKGFHIVPGITEKKDPQVIVKANSEDSWVFVQIKEVNNTVTDNATVTKYVEWAIAEGWTQLGTTTDGISTYYRTANYDKTDADVPYGILAGNTVSYNGNLTKADIDALGGNQPQLIFKAFAVQEVTGEDAAAAWAKIDNSQKLS